MGKKVKTIFLKVIIIVALITLINIGFLLYRSGFDFSSFSRNLTGKSISELPLMISETYNGLSFGAKIFLIIQWLLLLTFVVFAFIKDRKAWKTKKVIPIDIEKAKRPGDTDIDTLYNLINQKKMLKISQIENAFHVNKEIALEWAQILETHDMATIEYPTLSEPVVKKISKKDKEKIK